MVFTLVQTVLSLETELWALYAGTLFIATVMFFPGGLAGLIMMHVPAIKMGNFGLLVVPYIKTLVPGLFTVLAGCSLVEMIFHSRHASVGDHEMTLFWTTFDSHAFMPWMIAIAVAAGGAWLTRRNAPEMAEAWHKANGAG